MGLFRFLKKKEETIELPPEEPEFLKKVDMTAESETAVKEYVEPELALWLSNGTAVTGLKELSSALKRMSAADYKEHVNPERNEIAEWVQEILNDFELARKLRQAKGKMQAARAVEKEINALKSAKKALTKQRKSKTKAAATQLPRKGKQRKQKLETEELKLPEIPELGEELQSIPLPEASFEEKPAEYFGSVFLPHIARFGSCSFSLLQRGYFPKGNGKVELDIRPDFHLSDYDTFADLRKALSQKLQGISMFEKGKLLKITGVSHASADLKKAEVAERQAHSAKLSALQQLQKQNLACPVSIRTEYSNSLSTGSGISLFAHFAAPGKDEPGQVNPVVLGSDSLGERGKPAEVVGQEAASALAKEISSGACVDRYLADQLIPFMAIAGSSNKGSSTPPLSTLGSLIRTSEITNHCRTNIFVVEQFLGRCFEVDEEQKVVRVTGY